MNMDDEQDIPQGIGNKRQHRVSYTYILLALFCSFLALRYLPGNS